ERERPQAVAVDRDVAHVLQPGVSPPPPIERVAVVEPGQLTTEHAPLVRTPLVIAPRLGWIEPAHVREANPTPRRDCRSRFARTMLRTRMAGSTGSVRPVPAVDKTAGLLRVLAEGGRPQGISELARALNVSKGTLRDILLTLDHYGYVVRDGELRFRLGPTLRTLAAAR